MPAARSTLRLTMPQPPHSIQRAPPLAFGCHTSSSARRLGEREVVRAQADLRALAEHRAREVLERAAQVRHREALVDREALELVEHRHVRGVELVGAEHLAGRDARRSAASRSSIERICTGLVCVRSTRCESSGSTKNVSCIARAGWSSSKFIASKLNHSFSSSGPSAISQPMPMKMSLICSMSSDSGCRAPSRIRDGSAVTSTRLALEPRGLLGRGELGLPLGERLGDPGAGLARRACPPSPARSARPP